MNDNIENIKIKTQAFEYEGDDNLGDEDLEESLDGHILTQSQDPTVEVLYNRFKRGRLILQSDFQRQFVWDNKKASLLIESILLNIPLPVIYLSEEDNGNHLVIDGQQRLTSIFAFIDGEFNDGKIFKLSSLNVLKDLNKKSFKDISNQYQEKIMCYSLRTITIQKESSKDLKFNIFQRLNSGSVSLNDMELRNCLYRGKYNEFIKSLSKNADFQILIGLNSPEKRMKDVEFVLRFFAFYNQTYLKYKAPMKKFLNNEMEQNKNIADDELSRLEKVFKNTLSIINSIFGKNSFKRFYKDSSDKICKWELQKLNVSVYDVLMWVFADKDKNIIMRNLDALKEGIMDLMIKDEEFIDSITKSTSGVKQVKCRFDKIRNLVDTILKNEVKQERCFSYKLKQELFDKNSTCELCGQKIQTIEDSAIDHIEQYWLGGKTIPENARLTHRYCNMARAKKE